MTPSEKISFCSRRIEYWRGRLLVDPKIRIKMRLATLDELTEDRSSDESSEALKQEELLVSLLERVLVGGACYAKVLEAHERPGCPGGTLAELDDSLGCYYSYTIILHPGLLWFDGPDFRAVANSTICHEVLHVVVWPLTSYIETLKQRKSKCQR